ncbi:MAG: zf-HC2 domain-containing protein [Clostridiales bacterium]|nr:zf-HC2 domain-containing protein [Clostridiales bacterium]
MNDNLSCEIIKDLLPNYVENKLSEDSILLVNTHIKKCQNCKKEYLSMKSQLPIDYTSNTSLNYFKKINNKFFILLFTLLFLIITAIIFNILFYSKDFNEGFFTIFLLLFIVGIITVQYILPIIVLVFCSFNLMKSKNKLLLIPIIISFIWLIYRIYNLFINYFSYSF